MSDSEFIYLKNRLELLEDIIDSLDEKVEKQKILLEALRVQITQGNQKRPTIDSLLRYKDV